MSTREAMLSRRQRCLVATNVTKVLVEVTMGADGVVPNDPQQAPFCGEVVLRHNVNRVDSSKTFTDHFHDGHSYSVSLELALKGRLRECHQLEACDQVLELIYQRLFGRWMGLSPVDRARIYGLVQQQAQSRSRHVHPAKVRAAELLEATTDWPESPSLAQAATLLGNWSATINYDQDRLAELADRILPAIRSRSQYAEELLSVQGRQLDWLVSQLRQGQLAPAQVQRLRQVARRHIRTKPYILACNVLASKLDGRDDTLTQTLAREAVDWLAFERLLPMLDRLTILHKRPVSRLQQEPLDYLDPVVDYLWLLDLSDVYGALVVNLLQDAQDAQGYWQAGDIKKARSASRRAWYRCRYRCLPGEQPLAAWYGQAL